MTIRLQSEADLEQTKTILVTGGAGFIGSNFVLEWMKIVGTPVVTLDRLTYAGNLQNLASLVEDPRHSFVQADICDGPAVAALLKEHRPRAVIHFAAESHVDRSIASPAEFVRTNVQGTATLLEAALEYWQGCGSPAEFRFLHVSTDEVYGSLAPAAPAFTETTPYEPNSPYAASKAASDHMVRAWQHTYGLPTLTTNCSNNYGPFQFPEKLIPLVTLNAIEGKPLPIYGDGLNIRDWLYVGDHCEGIRTVLEHGRTGECYNIGGENERTNLEVVASICTVLDELRPAVEPHARLITHVEDRPGHDRRYAINAAKITSELGWRPRTNFEQGLRRTIEWYLDNMQWVDAVRSGAYMEWMERNYATRATKGVR